MGTFEEELRASGAQRVKLTEIRQAYLRAHPETELAPNLRRLILAALRKLEDDQIVDLPKGGWDGSASPSLPRTIKIRNTVSPKRDRRTNAWLPILAFAADESNPRRIKILQDINDFMLSTRNKVLFPVPTKERSLHIFGDEKRLDSIRKGELTLFEGRVSLDDLMCYPVAHPLPYEIPQKRVSGNPILVLENYHSYDSFRRWNQEAAHYAAIAYGGGNAFRSTQQGVDNLDDLIECTAANGAFYIGDLDPVGAEILIGVNERRRADGRTILQPHCGLYRWLLKNGHRRPLDNNHKIKEDLAHRVGVEFPADITESLIALWYGKQRIPQESFGLAELSGKDTGTAGPNVA